MSDETVTDVSDISCPWCRRVVARVRHMGSQTPHPGALAFCKGCGGVSVFTDRTSQRRGLALRKPMPWDDIEGIGKNRQLAYWKSKWLN